MEFHRLKEVIASVLCVATNEITKETTFMGDLGADSLDLFQIVMGIEETFHIEIAQKVSEKIETVGEALELIHSAVEEKE